jgi:hypothetical protein
MSDNLYAPPQASLETAGTSGTGDFEIGRCLNEAWAATWANFPLWLGALLVLVVASGLATLTVIGFFLVVPVLGWGGLRFFLAMHDREAQLSDIFSGFSRYGEALVGMLAVAAVIILVSVLGQSVTWVGSALGSGFLTFIGYLVNFAVGVAVTSRLQFAAFLVVDRRMPAGEALRKAWDMTQPLVWKVVGLTLASYAVVLAGFVALIVGLIPASVVSYLMVVSAYRQMVGGPVRS